MTENICLTCKHYEGGCNDKYYCYRRGWYNGYKECCNLYVSRDGDQMTEKRVKNIGELKEIIKDLPNELPIEVEVHKMSGEYKIDHIYRCGNDNGEPIVSFYVKYVW